MSKFERFLKMTQTASQLKKLRWQEEDREREREEREEALNYMTPFEYQLFQKGKLPEGMGKEKEEKGAGLFPSLETIYGEKPARKGLFGRGAETGGVLRGKTARIQGTLKRRELHPLEQLEAEPKTAKEWMQRQMLSSGLPFEEMGAEQKFVGGRFGQVPSGYEDLTPEQRARASRIATKLEAGETSRAVTADERAKRYEDIPEDKRTKFQNKFLEKYYGEGKSTQLERDKEYVRRRLTTMITSAITERAKQGETISKALAIKTPEVRKVLAELRPIYPDAVEEILTEMGVPETIEIPPSLSGELDKHNSYDEFYRSLSSEDQSLITPEEKKAIKQYYGTF